MRGELWNIKEADREVVMSLLHEILRRIKVSKLLQDQDGNLFIAHEFEPITTDEAQAMVTDLQADVADLQHFLSTQGALPGEQPAAPSTDQVPQDQAQPADPNQPVPPAQPSTDPAQTQPSDQAAPVDQGQVPDPNAAQPQPAAPADPNAGQPTPEQPVQPDPNAHPPLQ